MSRCCIAYDKRTGRIVLVHFGLSSDGWESVVRRDAMESGFTADEVGVVEVSQPTFEKGRLYKIDLATKSLVASDKGGPGVTCSGSVKLHPASDRRS
jgi:hypothetical protein